MDKTISLQAAIDALMAEPLKWDDSSVWESARCHQWKMDMDVIKALPSAQPEQTEMIKEIRKWINSGNRGSADYFIVDKIEEIINKYE